MASIDPKNLRFQVASAPSGQNTSTQKTIKQLYFLNSELPKPGHYRLERWGSALPQSHHD